LGLAIFDRVSFIYNDPPKPHRGSIISREERGGFCLAGTRCLGFFTASRITQLIFLFTGTVATQR
jgi:hypothetical protein